MSSGEQAEAKGGGLDPAEKLREQLANGLARARLNQTQLAKIAKLGRTTVSEALSDSKPVPSRETVAALAGALRLPAQELLALQRAALENPHTTEPGPGRPIAEYDPHDLEVHPAGSRIRESVPSLGSGGTLPMPAYVAREHDRVLAAAMQDAMHGNSQIVVLVGSSSTGKTRACWEAVQGLRDQGWRLWHPFDPTRAQAALRDLYRVGPRTVVWLNEAQHYLGDPVLGEQIAAAIHGVLTDIERGPVVVLATLWPEYARSYTAPPTPGDLDKHSRTRELISGRTLSVPDSFDAQDLVAARALAEGGDELMADALTRVGSDARVAQDLAGAPELLNRYVNASPAARALLDAAMDSRRLGVSLHLPQQLLTDAALGYLSEIEYSHLSDDWAERAYDELSQPVHGKHAPLRRTVPRKERRPGTFSSGGVESFESAESYRLADFLEQYGRAKRQVHCPPSSFWEAGRAHLTIAQDINTLSLAARRRFRLQWADALRLRAAELGSAEALCDLTKERELARDFTGAEEFAHRALGVGSTEATRMLGGMRSAESRTQSIAFIQGNEAGSTPTKEGVENQADVRIGADELYRIAAEHGDTEVLGMLAKRLEAAGDSQGAEAFAQKAARHGSADAVLSLADARDKAGDWEMAQRLYRQAVDSGDLKALCPLASIVEKAGSGDDAEALAERAADTGTTDAMHYLAVIRVGAGDIEGAKRIAIKAARLGNTSALDAFTRSSAMAFPLGEMLSMAREVAEIGDTTCLRYVARAAADSGKFEMSEKILHEAALLGDFEAMQTLALRRFEAEGQKGAKEIFTQAANRGSAAALSVLSIIADKEGDQEEAEILALRAAEGGDARSLLLLALRRETASDLSAAKSIYQRAVDCNASDALSFWSAMEERNGNPKGAEDLARKAATKGDFSAVEKLALMRAEDGDLLGAEGLALEAAQQGKVKALQLLTEKADKVRDSEMSTRIYRLIADLGVDDGTFTEKLTVLWPRGLDPDGTPTLA